MTFDVFWQGLMLVTYLIVVHYTFKGSVKILKADWSVHVKGRDAEYIRKFTLAMSWIVAVMLTVCIYAGYEFLTGFKPYCQLIWNLK